MRQTSTSKQLQFDTGEMLRNTYIYVGYIQENSSLYRMIYSAPSILQKILILISLTLALAEILGKNPVNMSPVYYLQCKSDLLYISEAFIMNGDRCTVGSNANA